MWPWLHGWYKMNSDDVAKMLANWEDAMWTSFPASKSPHEAILPDGLRISAGRTEASNCNLPIVKFQNLRILHTKRLHTYRNSAELVFSCFFSMLQLASPTVKATFPGPVHAQTNGAQWPRSPAVDVDGSWRSFAGEPWGDHGGAGKLLDRLWSFMVFFDDLLCRYFVCPTFESTRSTGMKS